MRDEEIIREIARRKGIKEELVKGYVESFWEGIRRSALAYQPVAIKGHIDFPLHKYIFRYKMMGKDLPMPEGVREAIEDMKPQTYNSLRTPGSLLNYKAEGVYYIGVVREQLGDEELLVEPLIRLTRRIISDKSLYEWERWRGDAVLIGAEHYKPTGNAASWLGRKRLYPVATAKGIIRICKSQL